MLSIMTMYLSVTSQQGRRRNKQRQNRTNLINQELKLDDSSAAVMLTVALHACSAKAESRASQGTFKQTWQGNTGKKNLVYLRWVSSLSCVNELVSKRYWMLFDIFK